MNASSHPVLINALPDSKTASQRVWFQAQHIFLLCLLLCLPSLLTALDYDPIDFVDPAIGANKATGGVNRMTNNTVGAIAPYGMIQLGPDNELNRDRSWAGLHLNIPAGNGAAGGMGFVGKIMPASGALQEYWPNRNPSNPNNYIRDIVIWEHLSAEPGYLRGQVIHDGVTMTVETTVGRRFGLIRITRPDPGPISVYMPKATSISNQWMDGQERYSGLGMFHWSVRLAKPADATNAYGVSYNNETQIVIMAAISSVSSVNARVNMPDEFPDFDTVAAATKDDWNQELSRVRLGSDTSEEMKTKFYTGLYRMLTYPQIYSDADGRYRRYDDDNLGEEIIVDTLPDDWDIYYTHFSGWDTFRIHTPFMALLDPHIASEQARTQMQDGRDSTHKRVPKWRRWDHDSKNMPGNSGAVITAWSYLLGANGFAFDQEGDLTILDNRSLSGIPRRPSQESDHGVAKFVLGLLGEKLGESSYAAARFEDSKRWWQLWNPDASEPPDGGGAIRTRSGDGSWLEDSTYTEAGQDDTQWLPHWDLAELVDRMGGTGIARARLARYMWDDELGRSRCYRTYHNKFTLYNQPVYSIPWTWGQIGDMHEQVREVHRIVNEDFLNIHGSQALPGNDDLGSTSAWMVWSVLGMYPFWPGMPVVALNLPMVDYATLDLGGKTLTVSRSGDGDTIAQVFVNGTPHDTIWVALGQLLEHEHNSLHFTTSPTGVWGVGATPINWRHHERVFPLAKPGIRAPQHLAVASGASAEVEVMIHDLITPAAALITSVNSNNQSLIADDNITLSGPWHNRRLSFSTAAAHGVAVLEITVNNEDGLSQSHRLVVQVGNGNVDNIAPVAHAGANRSLTAVPGSSHAGIVLDGSASYDPDGIIVSYTWTWNGGSASGLRPLLELPLGATTVTLTVTDNHGDSHSDTVTITINEDTNQPPVANAGGDRWYTIGDGGDSKTVILDASASYDPDGSIEMYQWNWDSGGALGVQPEVDLAPGVYDITLTVIDDGGAHDSTTMRINVYPGLNWESKPNSHVEVGQTYLYALHISGGNPGTRTITGHGLPQWLAVNDSSTAALTGSPSADDVGAIAITIRAEDGQHSIEQSFTVTVWEAGAGLGTRFRITIPDYQGPEAVEDYPLLLRLGPHIDSFHYHHLAYPSSGSDLRFSLMDGTPIPFSIGHWDPEGESALWLRMPRVDGDMEVLMTLGDEAHSSLPDSSTDGSVWAGLYDSVWHLDEASGERKDSSPNQLHAQVHGDIEYITGMVGRAAVFDGSDGNTALRIGDTLAAQHRYTTTLTFESWVWIRRFSHRHYRQILSQSDTYHSGSGYNSNMLDNDLRTSIGVEAGTGSGNARIRVDGQIAEITVPEEQWMHLATTWNGSRMRLYFNGEEVADEAFPYEIDYPDGILAPLVLGAGFNGSNPVQNRSLDGYLDEVRVAGHAHSPAWIWLNYHSVYHHDFLHIEPDVGSDLPVITSHPQSQAIVLNSPFTLSVTATGEDLNYQWRYQGIDIADATDPTYHILTSSLDNAGAYRVLVSNPQGSVLSQEANITILSRMISMNRIEGNLWNIDPDEHAGAGDDGSLDPVPFGPLPAERDHQMRLIPGTSN